MRLLLTRPEPQGERTATALRARGHDVVLSPLLEIEPYADVAFGPGPWAAVLITSANAVRFLAQHPRRAELIALPLLALGARSAEAAREAGFTRVQSADGDAQDLISLVKRVLPAGPLLYLAGEDRAADIAGALAGYQVATVVVYRARTRASLPEPVAAALRAETIDGVLHFSRRTAAAFLAAAAGSGLSVNSLKCNHFCLSPKIAATLKEHGATHLRVAPRPEEAALLELVEGL